MSAQPERFEGTGTLVLGPLSIWPPSQLSLVLAWQTDAGVVETWASPASTLTVVIKPSRGEPARLESCPIHGVQTSAFFLCVRWKYPTIDIRVNEHWVASTDTTRPTVSFVNIPHALTPYVALDLTEENEKHQSARRNEMALIKLRPGRLTASRTKPFHDLANALRQLADQVLALRRGELHQDTALAARLRAVVCRSKSSIPLLQRVAGILDAPLVVYSAIPSNDFVPQLPIAPHLACDLCMHVFAEPSPPYTTAMDLDFWLGLSTLELKGLRYTNSQIILAFADTEGAHYDPGVHPLVSALKRLRGISLHGPPMERLHSFLLDVALAVMSLSERVLANRERA